MQEINGAGGGLDLSAVVWLQMCLDAALQRDPKSRDLWYGRGQIFYNLKNYDESIASFKKVVELDPKDAQSQDLRVPMPPVLVIATPITDNTVHTT